MEKGRQIQGSRKGCVLQHVRAGRHIAVFEVTASAWMRFGWGGVGCSGDGEKDRWRGEAADL